MLNTEDFGSSFDWNTGSYLTGKNAVHGEKAVVDSNAKKVESNFKDKNGNPKTDIVVDLKMSNGDIKTLRLNKMSQTNFKKAGITPGDCKGTNVTINVVMASVAGEMKNSIVLVPEKNPLDF